MHCHATGWETTKHLMDVAPLDTCQAMENHTNGKYLVKQGTLESRAIHAA